MNDTATPKAPVSKPKPLNVDLTAQSNKTFAVDPNAKRLSRIAVDLIDGDPDQPRQFFDEVKLAELAESFKSTGLISPITVRVNPNDRDRYLVVAGERRFRATKIAGIKKIEAIVTDKDIAEIQLIENVQREDLKPLEEANAYKNYMASKGLTQKELAKVVGKTQNTISEIMSIATLPTDILKQLDSYPNITKSQLILIAKEKNADKRETLWFEAKNGLLTVKDARSVSKGEAKESALSPTDKALRALDDSLKKLAKLPELTADEVAEAKKTVKEINKVLKDKSA